MAAGSNKTVTASIVTWNHSHCIEACVLSLLQQTYTPLEIVLYDNASTDTTLETVARFERRIRIIHGPSNTGFCGGHNEVIKNTQTDLVLLVNPDVILSRDYIQKAVDRLKADPRIGTLCGLLLQNDPQDPGCLVDAAGLNMSRSRHPILRYHCTPLADFRGERREVFGCDGALPLFRREMIDDISINGQFFDPAFFSHKEDHDVAWRAQIGGWKTVFDSDCVAVHPRHFKPGNLKLRRRLGSEIKYHAVKNDLILLLKNEDWPNFIKDCLHIVPRQLAIFVYVLLFEQSSLKAYFFVVKNLSGILQQRKVIRRRRRTMPRDVRRSFFLGAANTDMAG